jgi:phosphatidylcholine synthase
MNDLNSKGLIRAGWALHIFTASGVIFAMIALQAVIDGRIRDGLLWLLLCQVIDGIDGPLARRIDVKIHVLKIDGNILDLVVDYVTCVIVPVAFLATTDLLPKNLEAALITLILMTSALWFARCDQETDDFWFNGFPASWNLVIPSFILLNTSQTQVLIFTIGFALLSLTDFKVPHLTKVRHLRSVTLPLAIIYLLSLTYLSWNYGESLNSQSKMLAQSILIAFPVYLLVISAVRTLNGRKK